jgi:hypothetical protein
MAGFAEAEIDEISVLSDEAVEEANQRAASQTDSLSAVS